MAKEKRTCPCPTEMARRLAAKATTCDQRKAAAQKFLMAMGDEIDSMAPSKERDKLEARLFAEAGRLETKAEVGCQFPTKSPAAIEAIYRARMNLKRSVEAAQQSRLTRREAISKASAAYTAAQQLAAYRRRMRAR